MNRKHLFIVALFAAMFTALPMGAQTSFGLMAGVNQTKVSLDNLSRDLQDKNKRVGFFVGPTVTFTLPIVGLGMDASVLYDHKSIQIGDENENVDYVDIPVNVRYTVGLGSLASVFINAGPQISFNVTGKDDLFKDFDTARSEFELSKSEFSINVGGGVKVCRHIQVSYNYNMVVGKTAELTFRDGANKVINGEIKNNTHRVAVAYLF